jgi:hypothetical protein
MPVLDAKALQRDPKGAAFLLDVLRSTSARFGKQDCASRPDIQGRTSAKQPVLRLPTLV